MKNSSSIIKIFEIFVFIVVLFILHILLYNNVIIKKIIKVNLKGDEYITLSMSNDYLDDGFELLQNDKLISLKNINYKITDNINYDIPGDYQIDYKIKYDGKKYNLSRKIKIVDDIKPTITSNKEYVEKYFCKKDKISSISYKANDNVDGDITNNIKKVELDDRIELSVVDSNGNIGELTIPIKYVDKGSNQIELNGKKTVYVELGGEYTENGAKLVDGCGKELDGDITISGEVDVNIEGEYIINYSYIDNEQEINTSRKVVVFDELKQTSTNPGVNKIVYLTFDDGPGQYTQDILNLLDKYNVKATFFVTKQFTRYIPLIKEEASRGHAIAVHSLTHSWNIYNSIEDYLNDFNQMNDIIEEQTGSKTNIFRFPGGSSNTVSRGHSTGIMKALTSKMLDMGYQYFDWNVDSGDASGASSEKIKKNVINGINKTGSAVVLMHDIKKTTRDALEDILKYGTENGFTFKTLDLNSPVVHHSVNN